LNGRESFLLDQRPFLHIGNPREGLAELPVSGVQESSAHRD
jgi:hypothetical protein